MPMAPAPAALVLECPALRWKSSILSNPTQLLEAPVSKIKLPEMLLIVALTNK
jgi:hypothetical protein